METTALDTAFTFGEPLWLWGLLIVPVLGGLFFWAQSKRKTLIALVVAPRLRDQLAAGVNPVLRGLRAALVLLALALALVALAKPRMGTIQREIKTNGRDVLLAIDTSRSMLATDVAPTRLARAKLISEDLLRLLQGDRIGIVAFAGSAFLQAPLTLDYNAVRDTLDDLDTNTIPRGGTNIAEAIETSMTAFGKAEGVLRALVIMTDGEELDADGVAAAKKAAAQGVRIFAIGIGTTAGAPISIQNEDGSRDYVRDADGKMVQSKLDSKRLSEIAAATGGFYAPFSADVAREIFTKGIEPMSSHDTGMLSARQPIEQYQWPLGGAIGCLMLWVLIGEGRGRRRNGAVARTAALLVVMFTIPTVTSFAETTGLEQYQKGDYQGALKSFEKSATTTPEKEKARFDAGAAAYKSGDYDKAVDHFTSALLSEDPSLRAGAAYNLGNALVRRGEKAESPQGKEKDWKDAITHYDDTLKLEPNDADAKANRDLVTKLLEDLKKQQEQQKQNQQQKQDQKKDQKQDQKQDQQKQDQQKQDQQKQDQQKQDQQKQDQQKQDQQKQDQQKQDQQKQDQQKQDQQKQDQQKQDQQKQDQQKQDQQKQDQQKQDQQKQDQQKQDQQKQDQQKQDQQKQDQQKQDQQKQGDSSQDQQPESRPQNQSQQGQPKPTPQPTPGEKKQGDLKAQPDQPKGDEKQPAAVAQPDKDGEMSEAQARALLRSMQGEEQRVRLLERQQNQDVLKDW